VLIDHEPIVVPEVDSPDLDRNEEDGSEGEGPKGREVEVYVPGKSTFAQTVSEDPSPPPRGGGGGQTRQMIGDCDGNVETRGKGRIGEGLR
jgi:hypothetical protein